MKNLLYFDLQGVPGGVVTSTARAGEEWFNAVRVGDPVKVQQVGDKHRFGISVVVHKELLSYADVLANAQHNSVGYGKSAGRARSDLWDTIHRAYGNVATDAKFSVLHLIPVSNLPDVVDTIAAKIEAAAKQVVNEVLTECNTALKCANKNLTMLTAACNILQGRLEAADAHIAEIEAPDEVEARATIDHITNVAAGAIAARGESADVACVAMTSKAGAVENVVSVIFK